MKVVISKGVITFLYSDPHQKAYSMGQPNLLPPSLEELTQEGHPICLVSQVVDQTDIKPKPAISH